MSSAITPAAAAALNRLDASSPVDPLASTIRGGGGAGAAPAPSAFSPAEIATGPLGLRLPQGGDDLSALLVEVEMDLDKTGRDNRAAGIQGAFGAGRFAVAAGAQAVLAAGSAVTATRDDLSAKTADQAALQTAQAGLQTRSDADEAAIEAAQAAIAEIKARHNPPLLPPTPLTEEDEREIGVLQGAIDAATDDKTSVDAQIAANGALILADQKAIDADAAALPSLVGALQASGLHLFDAFSQLALTLRTGDGQFLRNAVRSIQLDGGFDALRDADTASRARDVEQTLQADAGIDLLRDRRDADARTLALNLSAGLADVRDALAALKAAAAPSRPPDDRRRLIL